MRKFYLSSLSLYTHICICVHTYLWIYARAHILPAWNPEFHSSKPSLPHTANQTNTSSYILEKEGAHIPLGRPWLPHPLGGGLHTWQPTARPGEWHASCCWGHNPSSPAPCPGKAVRGKCRGVKETLILSKAESDRPNCQKTRPPEWWKVSTLRRCPVCIVSGSNTLSIVHACRLWPKRWTCSDTWQAPVEQLTACE